MLSVKSRFHVLHLVFVHTVKDWEAKHKKEHKDQKSKMEAEALEEPHGVEDREEEDQAASKSTRSVLKPVRRLTPAMEHLKIHKECQNT